MLTLSLEATLNCWRNVYHFDVEMGRGVVSCAITLKGSRKVQASCYGVPGRADSFVTVIYFLLIKEVEI